MKKLTKLLILLLGILVGMFIIHDTVIAQPNVNGNGKKDKSKNNFPPDGKGWTKFCDCVSGNHDHQSPEIHRKCNNYCNNNGNNNVPIDGGIIFLFISGGAIGAIKLKKVQLNNKK